MTNWKQNIPELTAGSYQPEAGQQDNNIHVETSLGGENNPGTDSIILGNGSNEVVRSLDEVAGLRRTGTKQPAGVWRDETNRGAKLSPVPQQMQDAGTNHMCAIGEADARSDAEVGSARVVLRLVASNIHLRPEPTNRRYFIQRSKALSATDRAKGGFPHPGQ